VSDAWLVVLVVGASTVLLKAAGPVFLGRRALPPRVLGLVDVLAPAMLAALVVTQAVGGDERLVFDERLAGIGAAAVALVLRAPLVVVIAVAALAAAVLRLAG
jgi:branched-subunit amino acid transport protein